MHMLQQLLITTIAIIVSSGLIALFHYKGWLGHLVGDVLLALILTVLILQTYPISFESTEWMRFITWPIIFCFLRLLRPYLPNTCLGSSYPLDTHSHRFRQEIERLFEFEEIE